MENKKEGLANKTEAAVSSAGSSTSLSAAKVNQANRERRNASANVSTGITPCPYDQRMKEIHKKFKDIEIVEASKKKELDMLDEAISNSIDKCNKLRENKVDLEENINKAEKNSAAHNVRYSTDNSFEYMKKNTKQEIDELSIKIEKLREKREAKLDEIQRLDFRNKKNSLKKEYHNVKAQRDAAISKSNLEKTRIVQHKPPDDKVRQIKLVKDANGNIIKIIDS